MPTEFRGTIFPLLQWERRRFDPQRGYVYEAGYKGLTVTQIQALEDDFVSQNIAVSVMTQGNITTLEAIDSNQQYVTDTWNLDGDAERLDGFSHPTLLALLGTNPDNWATLRTSLENNDKPSKVHDDLTGAGYTSSQADIIVRFYSLQQRGSTEFENDAFSGGYVLRHASNIPNQWAMNVADFNVGKIYTTAELLTEVQDSGLWTKIIDSSLAYVIANVIPPAAETNYVWGWRKKRASRSSTAYNRINIVQNYVLELWSTDYYAAL